MKKKLIINADDFGLTEGICKAIVTLFEKDAISNTTVMICTKGAFEHCKNYRNVLAGRTGVHLQITAENFHKVPLSSPEEIPTLVDAEGTFRGQDQLDGINPEEVEKEWERQIEKTAEALGTLPSHIDSHHGCHRIEKLIPIYLKLASKYGLCVRGGQRLGQIDAKKYGVKSSSLSLGDWTGQNDDLQSLKTLFIESFKQLSDGDILELVTHPGFCDEELLKASPWNSVRENDFQVLQQLAEEKWLASENISLTRFESTSSEALTNKCRMV